MNAIKRVLPLLLTLSLLLLPACGTQTIPAASPSSLPAPSASAAPTPAASPTPTVTPGRLLDRTGQALDLPRYAGLTGAEEAFAHYLQSGYDVSLTIDLALQQQAQTLLAEALDDSGGAVVMVDVKTGAPLVIASHGQGGNRALLSAYQPGNLFLPCTAIAALRSNIVTPDWEIKCQGVFDKYQQDGLAPECWIWNAVPDTHYTHPEENITTALRDCCYYYFYTLGNDLGNMELVACAEGLGLGQPTGIELPEATGTLASLIEARENGGEWRIGDTLEAAVGRGSNAFTPLQMAEYCAAIANSGQRHSASVLSSVTARDGTVLYTRQPEITGNVQGEKDSNWAAIHQGMQATMHFLPNEANWRIWQDCSWQVAGMVNKGLFMGYAPYEAPQVAIFAVAEDAANNAPAQQIARELLTFYAEQVNIK
ncbi:MAG: penicillin-binding transpeptidase domain-containing protein [Candidatus Limivicinus sp.]